MYALEQWFSKWSLGNPRDPWGGGFEGFLNKKKYFIFSTMTSVIIDGMYDNFRNGFHLFSLITHLKAKILLHRALWSNLYLRGPSHEKV